MFNVNKKKVYEIYYIIDCPIMFTTHIQQIDIIYMKTYAHGYE